MGNETAHTLGLVRFTHYLSLSCRIVAVHALSSVSFRANFYLDTSADEQDRPSLAFATRAASAIAFAQGHRNVPELKSSHYFVQFWYFTSAESARQRF